MKKNPISPKNTLNHDRAFERRANRLYAMAVASLLALTVMISPTYAVGGDPLAVINNLSDFIFSLIRAVGMILLGFSVLLVGMSLKSHDPSAEGQWYHDCHRRHCYRFLQRECVRRVPKQVMS